MNQWLTWDLIGTFTGAVAVTTALTQIVKYYFAKVDPKWIALAVAALVTAANALFQGEPIAVNDIVLMVLNALTVTGASVGLFEAAVKPLVRKAAPKGIGGA